MTPDSLEARANPFHLGLPGQSWMTSRSSAILEEAQARGTVLEDPSSFLLLAQVGAALMDLRPDGADQARDEVGQEALRQEVFHSFGIFFFQAFHLLRPDPSGRASGVLISLDGDGDPVSELVAPTIPVSSEPWDLPASAGYVALPANRFWARVRGPDAPAEAVDGVGWVMRPGSPDALSVMAISGLIPGRPGFSVLPVPPVPWADAPGWANESARGDEMGMDFAPNLPGAELGGLHGIETAGELLKIVARCVWMAGTGRLQVHAFPPLPDEPAHAP